jgi:hypothetical protein
LKCVLIASGVFALTLNGALVSAQTTPPAAPDPHAVQPERPTVATHAGTVAKGWVELEFGVEFDRYADRSRGGGAPIAAKIGLTSRAQLNISGADVRPPGIDATGFGDLAVGVKWRLLDDAPVLGRFAILPSIKMPTGSTATQAGSGTTDASILLISSHNLGPVALDVNLGYTRRSGSGEDVPKDATVWTVSFGGPIKSAFGWTTELFGYPKTAGQSGGDSIVALLAGPTATIRPWLALDAGVIIPITGSQPHALYVGGVWNIGKF